MTPPVNYRDESGGWDATLDAEGNMLFGALVEPSAEFEARRNKDAEIADQAITAAFAEAKLAFAAQVAEAQQLIAGGALEAKPLQ